MYIHLICNINIPFTYFCQQFFCFAFSLIRFIYMYIYTHLLNDCETYMNAMTINEVVIKLPNTFVCKLYMCGFIHYI